MDVLLTLVGLLMLVAGAEVMIKGAVDIALRARISPLVVGLTVVSLGTSFPELLVSLLAALKGNPALAIGNVVGSNIANLSLVLGASILIFPLEVDRDSHRIHWPVMMLVTVAFTAMLWNDHFARWEGIVFVLLLAGYIISMIMASRRSKVLQGSLPPVTHVRLWRSLIMLLGGIGTLALGADWFVDGAVGLARTFGVSDQMIGVTIVALGTSLPELVTSLMAALRKQPDISLGNLIGSNVFNLLGIIGITSMVQPIFIDHVTFYLDLGMMIFISMILYPLMRTRGRLGRWQGGLLLCSYALYMILVVKRG